MDLSKTIERELLRTAEQTVDSAYWRIAMLDEDREGGIPTKDDITHVFNCLRAAKRILRDVIEENPASYLLQLRKMTDQAAKAYAEGEQPAGPPLF